MRACAANINALYLYPITIVKRKPIMKTAKIV
jgi:hypothetical protein